MHILGLDLGSRTLGIAMSTTDEKMALTKETFRFEEEDYDAAVDRTLEYIDEYDIKEVVLGLPKHMNGDLGEKAELSMEFKRVLEDERDVIVHLQDERLTTVAALKTLASLNTSATKRKANVDQLAAQTILQDFLDGRKNNNGQ